MTDLRIVETVHGFQEVFDGDDYLGLLQEFPENPLPWRTHGTRLSLDYKFASKQEDFATKDEAVAWLLDGAES